MTADTNSATPGIVPVGEAAMRTAKALAWVALVALSLYFLWKNAARYLEIDPAIYRRYWPKRGWFWLHIGGGALTLLLGPLQFVSRLRSAWPRMHRWNGRIYLVALLIGFTGAAQLSLTTPLGWTVAVAISTLAVAWLATALIAWLAIRARNIPLHREWMLRNYTITFAFVSFRLATELPAVNALGSVQEVFSTFLWLSWVPPLLLCEIALCAARLRGSARVPTR